MFKLHAMEDNGEKRLGSGVVLLFLGPALIGALSGCNSNCDDNRSTLTTRDDCGTGRSGSGGGYVRSGGGLRGGGVSAPRSGGFGRIFSGGG